MSIAETCPDCGAERLRWQGGSHRRYCSMHQVHDHPVCCDERTPEDVFKNGEFSYMSVPNMLNTPHGWPVL